MAEKACVKRLQKEYRSLCKEPVSHVTARPSPNDILEWHYVLEGSEGTPFAGGYYYGKIKFPPEYPFKPPGIRGTVIHKRYFYGSVSLLPLTAAFTVLPLPNIPFFWVLFRTYSHWRALKGSERLLQLVSDSSASQNSSVAIVTKNNSHGDSEDVMRNPSSPPWVLQPSEELEKLVQHGDADHGLSKCILSDICKTFDLNTMDVVKYSDSV